MRELCAELVKHPSYESQLMTKYALTGRLTPLHISLQFEEIKTKIKKAVIMRSAY